MWFCQYQRVFQVLWRRRSATTVHRALPVYEEWPALSMPWPTARRNAALAVCSRCGRAYTAGCCGRAGQVVWGGASIRELCSCGAAARQSQRTEPCQYVSSQSWACYEPLQAQMQPLQCAAGVVEPALGAAARLGRWFVKGGAVLLTAGVFQMRRCRSATTAHRALAVCEWPALDMPWAAARSN